MSPQRIGDLALVAAAIIALALILILTNVASPGATGPAAAEAADCVPVQHSKKHVHKKKVRRHGKLVTRRKKHIHRWTTCEPAPAPLTCAVPSSSLGVVARDATGSSFTLSRACVTAGQVTVELNNQGEDPHNVFLRPISGPDPRYSIPADPPYELGQLSQEEATFGLAAGEWYLWCDLLLHEEQGMNAYLTVR